MKLTIIISFFNKKKYIKKAIDSALKQNDPDWELIICDDASQKEDAEFLEKLINKIKDPRITLIKNKANLGTGYSLHKMILIADTDIIVSLDADDALSSNAIQTIKKVYKDNPDIGFTYSAQYICDELLTPRMIRYSEQINEDLSFTEKFMFTALRSFKKESYLKTTGYDTNIPYCDDNDISFKLEEVAKGFYIDKVLYFYRQVRNSMSQDHIKKQRAITSLTQLLLQTKHRRDTLGLKTIDWDKIFNRIKNLRIYYTKANVPKSYNKLKQIYFYLNYKFFKKIHRAKPLQRLGTQNFPQKFQEVVSKSQHLRSFVYSAKHNFAFLNIEGNAYEDLLRIVIDNNWNIPCPASNFNNEIIQNFIGFHHDNEFKLTINNQSLLEKKTIRFAVIRDPIERFFSFLETLPNHYKYTEPMILEQILFIEKALEDNNRDWLKLHLIPQADLIEGVELDYLIHYSELTKFLEENFNLSIKITKSTTETSANPIILKRLEKIYLKDFELSKNILK
jgi:glycosyltransferase involved in cell wall biosynthesis